MAAISLVQVGCAVRAVGDTWPARAVLADRGFTWDGAARAWVRPVAAERVTRDLLIAGMSADAAALCVPAGACFLASGEGF